MRAKKATLIQKETSPKVSHVMIKVFQTTRNEARANCVDYPACVSMEGMNAPRRSRHTPTIACP